MEPTDVPASWGDRLHERADFESSFNELDGFPGYTPETLRGRVRSLQMRLEEADRHFRRAAELLAATTHRDLAQVALTDAYQREHGLLTGQPWQRSAPTILRLTDEKLKAIDSLRKSMDALEALHDGRPETALSIYRECLYTYAEAGPERQALWHLGIAASEVQLDEPDEAVRHLEIAGLFVCDPLCRTLGRAQISARLATVHAYLKDHDGAHSWWDFLTHVSCPESTRRAMRKRAALIGQHSDELGRCVLC